MQAIPFILVALLTQVQPAAPQAMTQLAAVPAQRPPPPSLPPRFHVLVVRKGILLIDAGQDAGLKPGDHVALFPQRSELGTEQMTELSSPSSTTVVALDRVGANRAEATLGRGDSAQVGDLVERTNESLST